MSKLKIGTFNMENLFLRYRLLDKERGSRAAKPIDWDKFLTEGGFINQLGFTGKEFYKIDRVERRLTAKVISEHAPAVLAVQEVENLEAMIQFNRHFLKNAYPYMICIDGNDLRQIDVALLSKHPLGNLRTHRFEPEGSAPNARTFSRDCLEVEITPPGGQPINFLVNHFKSQLGGGAERRAEQAARVAAILEERYGKTLKGHFVVLGDLNAAPDAPELQALLGLPKLENVVNRLPAAERWTHVFKKEAAQLDYLLLSPALSKANPATLPVIERRGLPTAIKHFTGNRFSGVTDKLGASDHCGLFFELEV